MRPPTSDMSYGLQSSLASGPRVQSLAPSCCSNSPSSEIGKAQPRPSIPRRNLPFNLFWPSHSPGSRETVDSFPLSVIASHCSASYQLMGGDKAEPRSCRMTPKFKAGSRSRQVYPPLPSPESTAASASPSSPCDPRQELTGRRFRFETPSSSLQNSAVPKHSPCAVSDILDPFPTSCPY